MSCNTSFGAETYILPISYHPTSKEKLFSNTFQDQQNSNNYATCANETSGMILRHLLYCVLCIHFSYLFMKQQYDKRLGLR